MWEVEATDQFVEWWTTLTITNEKRSRIELNFLQNVDPIWAVRSSIGFTRPGITMKELRAAKGGALRVLNRRVAETELGRAKLVSRRHARTQLAATDERLVEANMTLDRANTAARPTDRARSSARHELDAARSELRNRDLIERWRYLPEAVHAERQRIEARDAWHDWAEGIPMPAERLGSMSQALHGAAQADPTGIFVALADVIHRWANHHSSELCPTVQRASNPSASRSTSDASDVDSRPRDH